MTYVDEEITSQPDCWSRAAALCDGVRDSLPAAGERVAVIGCGTSWFMAQAYAARRETGGLGQTDAFAASEVPLSRGYDRVVAITRSGTTTEVLEVLDRLAGRVPTLAITADRDAPVHERSDESVALDFADERSVVQTRFATSVLALLRASLGEDLAPVVADGRTALSADAGEHAGVDQVTFLGTGWTIGIAYEAALKMREAAGAWTEAYPAMEYRHGPISITGPNRLVWVFGDPPPGLTDEIAATGGRFERSHLDPMADLIRVQRLAVALAVARGLDPNNPRHLSRSVILAGSR